MVTDSSSRISSSPILSSNNVYIELHKTSSKEDCFQLNSTCHKFSLYQMNFYKMSSKLKSVTRKLRFNEKLASRKTQLGEKSASTKISLNKKLKRTQFLEIVLHKITSLCRFYRISYQYLTNELRTIQYPMQIGFIPCVLFMRIPH